MWCLSEWPRQLKATRQAKVVCSSAVMTSSTAEWLLRLCSADSPTEAMTWWRHLTALAFEWLRNVATKFDGVRFKLKIIPLFCDLCHQGKPFNWRRLAGDMKMQIISKFLLCQVRCHMSVIINNESRHGSWKVDFYVYLFFRYFRFGNNRNLVFGEDFCFVITDSPRSSPELELRGGFVQISSIHTLAWHYTVVKKWSNNQHNFFLSSWFPLLLSSQPGRHCYCVMVQKVPTKSESILSKGVISSHLMARKVVNKSRKASIWFGLDLIGCYSHWSMAIKS